MDATDRAAVLGRVLLNPPHVHLSSSVGVWQTDRACYELMAARLPRQAVTLETGLGVSTALFAAWGCRHTCVVGSQGQVDRLRTYCEENEIDLGNTSFEVGNSQDVLPRLSLPVLDLVLIDGGHGYPTPIIDWFYGCRSLRAGGLVIVDDMHLPAVSTFLGHYLTLDPAWSGVASQPKWAAFKRTTDAALGGEWTTQQSFLGGPRIPVSTRLKVRTARALSASQMGRRALARYKR